MDDYFNKVRKTADYLKAESACLPKILIMSGTGLGDISDSINESKKFKYKNIPGFPETTVESHTGELVFGELNGKQVAVMIGRFHLYEGYSPLQITFPIRVMHELGVKILIVTNASGGINLNFNEGSIMIIDDHINLTGKNPLTGPNNDKWGLRFPDMINAYDKELILSAEEIAKKNKIATYKGVYAGLTGPSLETPAEIRYLKAIGADSVGFSTIQEVITAVHVKMRILGLSVITNINNPDDPKPATLESVVKTAKNAAPSLKFLIEKIVEKINE